MQVKCDFCGSFMEDGMESCPNCGAANSNLKRTAGGTPKTIEELKEWYVARNLPPYETTRFFIGEDYKGAKAFGIFRDGDEFTVYKNKADGSRAVRYKGKDEAYAVNELYLRLKEEILNQKNRNEAKSKGSFSPKKAAGKAASCMGGCLSGCLFLFIKPILAGLIILLIGGISVWIDSGNPQRSSYYLSESKVPYYYYGESYAGDGYEWWTYDDAGQNWSYSLISKKNDFPDGIDSDNLCGSYGYLQDMADNLGLDYDDFDSFKNETPYNILNSRDYVDRHHYAPSQSAYYDVNGKSYYYLNDAHGASYGNGDNSGWYVYNDSAWDYYCDAYDKDTLGDDLWYNDDRYYVGSSYSDYSDYISGSVYSFSDTEASNWSSEYYADDFSNTSWYEEVLESDQAYEDYWATHSSSSSSSGSSDSWSSSSSWDSDSSWDWDSGSSWDSGGSDWSSDW